MGNVAYHPMYVYLCWMIVSWGEEGDVVLFSSHLISKTSYHFILPATGQWPSGQAPVSGRFMDLVPALLVLQQRILPPTVVGEVGSEEGGAPRHQHHCITISTVETSIQSP